MAHAVFGVQVLRQYSEELREKGLDPPVRWAGSPRAIAFVESLGFSREHAGFEDARRDPWQDVFGPVDLKPLHDYQATIVERITAFLSHDLPQRGLLSLPTGAGKTRVAVEALIRGLMRVSSRRYLLWIAQTDELCEQAVQSWAQAWRSIGSDQILRISRYWGGQNAHLPRLAGQAHVVVSTFQTLNQRLGTSGPPWLLNPDCVVIDEAHGSVAPSYTEILAKLQLTQHTTARRLIGLTATPFRGGDEEETQRLVSRYQKRRFDDGLFDDPYSALQERGVLARVRHDTLDGTDISLTPDEVAHLTQFSELPDSVNERLAGDSPRNDRIVDSITRQDPDWPILVFAASVDHARLLAARLTLRGIVARPISGDMDHGARRHHIEEFRAGRLRVLTNYNVLATGFDAPAVRAIYVGRPVYSRLLYQQMVGRGLRGPLNGGKDECLLVNVADNVAQYGKQLAFRHFEEYWR